MQKIKLHIIIIFCLINVTSFYSQQKYPTLIRSSIEDEIIILSLDKIVYFPGDTVRLKVIRNDSVTTVSVNPILIIEDAILKSIGNNEYKLIIPQGCEPGQYKVRLGVLDSEGRRFVYETDCKVEIEENQFIEQVNKFVSFLPKSGSEDINSAVTLNRNEIRKLRVVFQRDSISQGMGPQFVTIVTSVHLRDGTTTQSFERRVLTFRSDNDTNRDRAMLVQYRRAYGIYAAIRQEEFSEVNIHLDSLPDWAIIKINVQPDYTIKIGGFDRNNTYTRYFRVKGPSIEVGFSLGIPKVLYDTHAYDPLDYGNTSAMLRFYIVNEVSGNRFPVNLGIGTFGVSSPLDINIGRGGFALSVLLDVAEMARILDIDFMKNISAGIEFAPFFPIKKRARLLINAQVGISL